LETRTHRGVELLTSTATGPALIARVGGRIVIANERALAMRLVDAALDSTPRPRTAGDEIVANGAAAARVIADAKAILATGWIAERAGSEAKARAIVDGAERLLLHAQEARVRFDLDGTQVKLDVEVVAPGLFGAATRAASVK
jgi:hypothetical protein